jgi:hypothetical protein
VASCDLCMLLLLSQVGVVWCGMLLCTIWCVVSCGVRCWLGALMLHMTRGLCADVTFVVMPCS